jgi:membrane protease subunit HflK
MSEVINVQNRSYLKYVWLIVVAVILVFLVSTSFYTVGETERAVVTTFGKVTSVNGAGLQFKLPYPIQDVQKVDMTTRKLTIGYSETGKGNSVTKEDESKMITGDYNVVSVDFFMEWKVSDPQKYLFNSVAPEKILKNIAQAAARDVMGSKTVDDVLTTGKVAIQTDIKDIMVSRLEQYDIGIQIIEVKIQDN